MASVAPTPEVPEKGDVWNVMEFTTDEKSWSEMNGQERARAVLTMFFKVVLCAGILYLFIISLGLMANAFRILGGKSAGRAFRDSDLFDNPLAGLVTGILVTVMVQSSSTSTSIIITMTAGDLSLKTLGSPQHGADYVHKQKAIMLHGLFIGCCQMVG